MNNTIMEEKIEEKSDEESEKTMTTIAIPSELKRKLDSQKIIEREPYYAVIQRLYDKNNGKPHSKKKK